jgi:hypothetical protein
MLHELILDRNSCVKNADVHERLEVDVLLTGCEASLWIGEQFASDLQDLFPALRVVAMSANKIIGTFPRVTPYCTYHSHASWRVAHVLRILNHTMCGLAGVLSNTRGSAPMSGFAFSSRTMSLKKTIVIALSHSGQTFPTLHATHALRKLCGDRVFVLTGISIKEILYVTCDFERVMQSSRLESTN